MASRNGRNGNKSQNDELDAFKKEIGRQYMDGLISEKEYTELLANKTNELGLNSKPATDKSEGGRECPTCGALVNGQDVECKICGTILPPELVSKEETQSTMQTKQIQEVPANWREEWLAKQYRQLPIEELLKMPPDVLKGVSAGDSRRMKDAFNITTVEQFAINKYLIWAQELVALRQDPGAFRNSDFKHKLIKEFEEKGFEDILKSSTYALRGVSEKDSEKLNKAFNTKTVEELGSLKFITWARKIYDMAPPRRFKVGERVLMPDGQVGRVSSVTEADGKGLQKVEVAVGQ